MNSNFDMVRRHFEAMEIAFTAHPESHWIEAGFSLANTHVQFGLHAPPDEAALTFVLALPVAVPPERRAAVGEFLHRLNRNMCAGAFELDYDHGEVRFAMATLPDREYAVSEPAFRLWLMLATTAVDGYFQALMKVAFGGASPAPALEQAEAHMRDYLRDLGVKQE